MIVSRTSPGTHAKIYSNRPIGGVPANMLHCYWWNDYLFHVIHCKRN